MILLRVIILIFLFIQPALAQKKDIVQKKQNLRRIRKEIELYKNKVKSESVKEKNILDVLSALDHEVDLTHALLVQLKQEDKKNANAILKVAYELKAKRVELERIQEIYKKRLVYFYKYGRIKDIELLLTARSFNQVLSLSKAT